MHFVHKFTHEQTTHASPASNSAKPPLPPLEAVLQTQYKNLKEQINNIDYEYSTQYHIRAQRRQQRQISKHPALANKEIFNDKSTTSPQAQELINPGAGKIETDPCKIVGIVE
eukprot:153256-Pelagomonas_calceolata.AAC.1